MIEQLPPYRRQHAPTNPAPIHLGVNYAREHYGTRVHPAPFLVEGLVA